MVRVTIDTNVLVRAAVDDDPEQANEARALLRDAERIVLTLPALCEFVWVARRAYRRSPGEVSVSLRRLIAASNAQVEVGAVEAGLRVLDAGGDFADGIIAFDGRRQGGAVFASFDRRAVRLVAESGGETYLLGREED